MKKTKTTRKIRLAALAALLALALFLCGYGRPDPSPAGHSRFFYEQAGDESESSGQKESPIERKTAAVRYAFSGEILYRRAVLSLVFAVLGILFIMARTSDSSFPPDAKAYIKPGGAELHDPCDRKIKTTVKARPLSRKKDKAAGAAQAAAQEARLEEAAQADPEYDGQEDRIPDKQEASQSRADALADKRAGYRDAIRLLGRERRHKKASLPDAPETDSRDESRDNGRGDGLFGRRGRGRKTFGRSFSLQLPQLTDIKEEKKERPKKIEKEEEPEPADKEDDAKKADKKSSKHTKDKSKETQKKSWQDSSSYSSQDSGSSDSSASQSTYSRESVRRADRPAPNKSSASADKGESRMERKELDKKSFSPGGRRGH